MTQHDFTLRRARTQDAQDLTTIITASGLFSPAEAEGFGDNLPDMLSGDDATWFRLDHGTLIAGAAYLTRDGINEDVFNLLFIAVAGAFRGRGGGAALISAAEDAAKADGGRLLLIGRSDGAEQSRARAVYRAAGYVQQGKIADYYAAGLAKVIFAKAL
ncbi:GNAT family N-acetyltransferase [Hasllibacter sp. MH4015]|uniref:GNAT family N-acetyltransferase n=1 Tax=Hasllibacter sp. MH4015 TaxID=2854029 RepID=UPI001CD27190|nr:GNAT family N-acetyltransferase [Hasllibacter sp. MH4015]